MTNEQIQQILNAPQTSSGAHSLTKFYQQQTGNNLNLGCFCKSSNINKVYTIVGDWFRRQQ